MRGVTKVDGLQTGWFKNRPCVQKWTCQPTDLTKTRWSFFIKIGENTDYIICSPWFDWNWAVIYSNFLAFLYFEFNIWPNTSYRPLSKAHCLNFRDRSVSKSFIYKTRSYKQRPKARNKNPNHIKVESTAFRRAFGSSKLFFIVRTALIVLRALHRCPESPDRWTGENCRGLSVWQMVVF